MISTMRRLVILLCLLAGLAPAYAAQHEQDTGFLNRRVLVNGATYKYVVYLPQDYNPHQSWPVILFLHGSGERGSDGETQTNVGLPAALRNHPERWPFVVVMPQLPYNHHYWVDNDQMKQAIAALDEASREFHGDPNRTLLTGLSLGGFGAWEIARTYPNRFAAVVPVCGGVRWDWVPGERREDKTLPALYAKEIVPTPVWIFHGADDPVVAPSQSEEMYEALKNAGGNVRFYLYERVQHASWDLAYGDPDLPKWLLAQNLRTGRPAVGVAEKKVVPIHPEPAKIEPTLLDAYVGEYSAWGLVQGLVTRSGDQLILHHRTASSVLLPETETSFFYSTGGANRIVFDREPNGKVTGLTYRDDRHEERWQKTH